MNTTIDSYVVFHLGGEEYGLPVSQVNSIIRYEPSTPVPRCPEAVMGVINLRGRIIPVVDLQMRFRSEPFKETTASRILVAEGAAGPVGIAVDSATEVAQLPSDEVKEVPEGLLSVDAMRAFTGVIERNGSLIILLSLDDAVPRSEYAAALPREGDSHV